jgi:hypothetical protein
MNETFLIITGVVTAYWIIQLSTGAFDYDASLLRVISTMISVFASLLLIVTSILGNVGDKNVSYSEATNTRIGDEFIIQSEFPTINLTDVKYENKPVRVKRTTSKNAFGVDRESFITYEVEIIK